ncbi:MAG TPA: AbrB/MazE/SpoVT family DNA-binding domain-containing protein [Terracidiphilus sp.]|jgi:bifunctional DNA-binding transcriptional regulator/antitoxin component of YhaV-PrlF toxin-antitoxin module|nr:AbrB/MazE/SpoVT family DNA-binding domain-containing protein [Terracidiphilus sp.]
MARLTVTARGQVTFRRDILQHLGVKPGEKIDLELLPNGRGVVRAAKPTGKIDSFLGVLSGKTRKVATLDEIHEAAAKGWAGQK